MMFGLKEGDICEIKAILKRFSEVEEALVFGSRAMGNYKPGSDVDIALKGQEVTFRTTLAIAGVLNEDTLMPYRFEVLSYKDLNNTALLRHIDRAGQLLYQVDTTMASEPDVEYKRRKEQNYLEA